MTGKGILDSFLTVSEDDAPAGFDQMKKPGGSTPGNAAIGEPRAEEPPPREPAAAKGRASEKRQNRSKPKAEARQVSVARLREPGETEPTMTFNQRVTEETAELFYNYAKTHRITMKETLARAAKALSQAEEADDRG